jgi:hypothetical protein
MDAISQSHMTRHPSGERHLTGSVPGYPEPQHLTGVPRHHCPRPTLGWRQ